MGVEDVWKNGYTGKNIKIAIPDVGISTDLLDLKNNVNTSWSYNFVDNNHNVTPDYYSDPASFDLTNHGNMVASVVAAEKDNEICMAGIAYDATIFAFKVFKVVQNSTHNNYSIELQSVTDGYKLWRALSEKFNYIDIFVNAWYPIVPFDRLDVLTLDAIERGAKMGRQGHGKIYVVPSGIPGNALSNSIYTVTVGAVGINGLLIPDIHRFVDASILVSALAEGNNLTSARLFTTTYQNHCISSFKGLSAATAIIGGIIALALEANNRLTLRDVQHLLVISAEHDCLTERDNFKSNGAGLYYHDYLGFGLINASKFVDCAIKSRGLPAHLEKRLDMKQDREIDTQTSKINEVEFCYDCQDLDDEDCITSVQHVSACVAMKGDTNKISVRIQSPRGTQSTLLQESKMHLEINGTFVSTHFWNEVPAGKWKIILQREHVQDTLQNLTLSLTLYGFYDKRKSRPNKAIVCEETSMVTDKDKKDKPEETSKPDGSININNKSITFNILIATYIPGTIIIVFIVITAVLITIHVCKTRNKTTIIVKTTEETTLLNTNSNANEMIEDHAVRENNATGSTPQATDKEVHDASLNATNNKPKEDGQLDNQSKEKETVSKTTLAGGMEELV